MHCLSVFEHAVTAEQVAVTAGSWLQRRLVVSHAAAVAPGAVAGGGWCHRALPSCAAGTQLVSRCMNKCLTLAGMLLLPSSCSSLLAVKVLPDAAANYLQVVVD
jgi:hypothetical protein